MLAKLRTKYQNINASVGLSSFDYRPEIRFASYQVRF